MFSIDSTTISYERQTLQLRGNLSGGLDWSSDNLSKMPRVLGESNPIRSAGFLAGVQTNAELDGGVHILGTETNHNDILLGSVPVYGANHLLGIFSIFNTTHFKSSVISFDNPESERLGGMFKMALPDEIPESISGEISVGMMSAGGTFKIPAGRKSAVFVSARGSFLNALYGNLLTLDGSPLEYGFSDYNLTWFSKPSDSDRLTVNAFLSNDRVTLTEKRFNARTNMEWGNTLASLEWEHLFDNSTLDVTAFATGYGNEALLDMELVSLTLPSRIVTEGLKTRFKSGEWEASLDIRHHALYPQSSRSQGVFASGQETKPQSGLEIVPSVKWSSCFWDRFSVATDLKAMAYGCDGEFWFLPSPDLELEYDMYRAGKLSLSTGIKRQALFKSGFSDIGFPIEFWISAGRYSAPQGSAYLDISYDLNFASGRYSLTGQAYCSKLWNQKAWSGALFDILSEDFSLEKFLSGGSGRNYGVNLMLLKNTGKLTGWMGYSYSRALRTFDDSKYGAWFPANHERLHEFDAVVLWHSRRWTVGSTLIVASGTPYTSPDYIYVASGGIMVHYRDHNSSRLDPYCRLDMSANYDIVNRGGRSLSINVSLYNVLCCDNPMYFRIDDVHDGYEFRQKRSLFRFLPSMSLCYKF